MKELDSKDAPEISGGEVTGTPGTPIVTLPVPTPTFPGPMVDYPQYPVFDPSHGPGHVEQ